MAKRPKTRRSVEEILQSTSDVLFPAKMGKHKVKLNSQDCEGDTPLHVIIWRQDTFAAKRLIEAGAKIDAIGDMGETPLHIALKTGNYDVAEALVRKGARTHVRSEFGETALDIARSTGGKFQRLLESTGSV